MSEDLNDAEVLSEKSFFKNLNPQAALDLKMMEFDTMILKSKEQTARLEREKSEFLLNFNYNSLEKQSKVEEAKERFLSEGSKFDLEDYAPTRERKTGKMRIKKRD